MHTATDEHEAFEALNSSSHCLMARKCYPTNHGPPFNTSSKSVLRSNLIKKKSCSKSIISIQPTGFHMDLSLEDK